MALNTAQNRYSMTSFGMFDPPFPLSSTIAEADRTDFLGLYRAIDLPEPVAVPDATVKVSGVPSHAAIKASSVLSAAAIKASNVPSDLG